MQIYFAAILMILSQSGTALDCKKQEFENNIHVTVTQICKSHKPEGVQSSDQDISLSLLPSDIISFIYTDHHFPLSKQWAN